MLSQNDAKMFYSINSRGNAGWSKSARCRSSKRSTSSLNRLFASFSPRIILTWHFGICSFVDKSVCPLWGLEMWHGKDQRAPANQLLSWNCAGMNRCQKYNFLRLIHQTCPLIFTLGRINKRFIMFVVHRFKPCEVRAAGVNITVILLEGQDAHLKQRHHGLIFGSRPQ